LIFGIQMSSKRTPYSQRQNPCRGLKGFKYLFNLCWRYPLSLHSCHRTLWLPGNGMNW